VAFAARMAADTLDEYAARVVPLIHPVNLAPLGERAAKTFEVSVSQAVAILVLSLCSVIAISYVLRDRPITFIESTAARGSPSTSHVATP